MDMQIKPAVLVTKNEAYGSINKSSDLAICF